MDSEKLWECPITHMRMVDPVMSCDGHTYERAAIQRWFDYKNTKSPLTGLPLANTHLIPNHALRSAILALAPPLPPPEEKTVAARDLAEALAGMENGASLDLSGRLMGNEGAYLVAAALRKGCVMETLNLDFNNIGAEGARAIALALRSGFLTTLHISNNFIGDGGCEALAAAFAENVFIGTMHLNNNSIGEAGARALKAAHAKTYSQNGLDLAQFSISRVYGTQDPHRIMFLHLSFPSPEESDSPRVSPPVAVNGMQDAQLRMLFHNFPTAHYYPPHSSARHDRE
jgi:hypothetical protein